MQNIRPFEIALLALFAVIGVVSVIVLAGFEGFGGGDESAYGDSVEIWGPFDALAIERELARIAEQDRAFNVVTYVEIDPRTFEDELVNAIAEGRGPDAVIVPHEMLAVLRTKLLPIPYESFPERDFRDRYIDGAEIFMRSDGVYALPIAIDPLVMYWNRDTFSTNGFSTPPATWETVVGSVVPALARISVGGTIAASALAFGEYTNVTNAKEVLLMLMLQSGSRLVTETERGYSVVLDTPPSENARPPATAAVQFFTNFSNTGNALYTWNRSLANDRTAFLAGDLALYFGFASEASRITEGNPNLNFDAAPVPQGASATVKRTYGTFYGLALVRSSDNVQGTYAAIHTFLNDTTVATLADSFSLVPASRTLIAQGSGNAFRQVAFDTALVARGWLDPDPDASETIFSQMIDDVVSGRRKVGDAVGDAGRRLELAF